MLKTQLVALASLLITNHCFALDTLGAIQKAEIASKLAMQGKYAAAWDEIIPMLRANSLALRWYGEDVLNRHTGVANARLAALDTNQLLTMACASGLEQARNEAELLVFDLRRYADDQPVAEATDRISTTYPANGDQELARKCQQLQDARDLDERKLKAAADAEALKAAPAFIRALAPLKFCVDYGDALRDQASSGNPMATKVLHLFNDDAARRGLPVNKALVLKQRIRIGITQCTLYAAWGFPRDTNRTVGPWGTHSQLVYGEYGPYVYLDNGVLRSFQD